MGIERFWQLRARGERGAALVEFALILPVFMTLVLGMFSGGQTYNDDLSIAHAAREGARYAATLQKNPPGLLAPAWSASVKDRIVEAATGDLDLSKQGHFVCVALVKPDGTVWSDSSGGVYSRTVGLPPTTPPSGCYSDGLTDTYSRVHVLVGRPGGVETLFYTHNLKLQNKGTARYEAA